MWLRSRSELREESCSPRHLPVGRRECAEVETEYHDGRQRNERVRLVPAEELVKPAEARPAADSQAGRERHKRTQVRSSLRQRDRRMQEPLESDRTQKANTAEEKSPEKRRATKADRLGLTVEIPVKSEGCHSSGATSTSRVDQGSQTLKRKNQGEEKESAKQEHSTRKAKKIKREDPPVQPAPPPPATEDEQSSGLDEDVGYYSGDQCSSEELYPIMTEEEKRHQVGVSVIVPLGGDRYCTECYKWATAAHLSSAAHLAKVEAFRRMTPVDQLARVTARIEEVAQQGEVKKEPEQHVPQQAEHWLLTSGDWKYCVVCFQWADRWHIESKKHVARCAGAMEWSEKERKLWMQQRHLQADQKMRGGMRKPAPEPVKDMEVVGGASSSAAASASSSAMPHPDTAGSTGKNLTGTAETCGWGGWSGGDVGSGDSGVAVALAMRSRNSDSSEQGEVPTASESDERSRTLVRKDHRCIHVRATRFSQDVTTCPHLQVESLLAHVALVLNVSPQKICFVHRHALVGTWGTIEEYYDMTGPCDPEEPWLVATWPISSSPKEYKLKHAPLVHLEAEEIACPECRGLATAEDAEGAWTDLQLHSSLKVW